MEKICDHRSRGKAIGGLCEEITASPPCPTIAISSLSFLTSCLLISQGRCKTCPYHNIKQPTAGVIERIHYVGPTYQCYLPQFSPAASCWHLAADQRRHRQAPRHEPAQL